MPNARVKTALDKVKTDPALRAKFLSRVQDALVEVGISATDLKGSVLGRKEGGVNTGVVIAHESTSKASVIVW